MICRPKYRGLNRGDSRGDYHRVSQEKRITPSKKREQSQLGRKMRTHRRAIAFVGVMSTALLYMYFRPLHAPLPPTDASAARSTHVARNEKTPWMEFALNVAGGRLVSGPALLQVARGTVVRIRIRSDRADELHLHGYDLELRIDANKPAELEFTADMTGRFEYELHRSHLELGALEVRPE